MFPEVAAAVTPVAALALLLVVAYRHPPEWVEALAGAGAAFAAALAVGLETDRIEAELRALGPVVGFLAAILVVAECCRADGLFDAVGDRLAALDAPRRRFDLVFVTAALTTIALSLDATVVLLTPVVLAAAAVARRDDGLALVCVRLANSGSLLLPVANLTTLLAWTSLDLTFTEYVALMAPVALVVLLVEHLGLGRLVLTRDRAPAADRPPVPARPFPIVTPIAVAVMLVGFGVASTIDLAPVWVALPTAVVLAVRALVTRRLRAVDVVRHAHLSFAVFVLGLGVVVAALTEAWLGEALTDLLPGRTDTLGLLALAAIGLVAANLLNNLPATLILAPLVAPLGAVPVLALLIGVNVGSAATWTGSLANLLWRRAVLRAGGAVDGHRFHLAGATLTPLATLLGVLVLAGWSRVSGLD